MLKVSLRCLSFPEISLDADNLTATEPWDEMLDRSLKGIHAERVEAELGVTHARWHTPHVIHRLSQQIEKRREDGEWVPEDDVHVGGELSYTSGRVGVASDLTKTRSARRGREGDTETT